MQKKDGCHKLALDPDNILINGKILIFGVQGRPIFPDRNKSENQPLTPGFRYENEIRSGSKEPSPLGFMPKGNLEIQAIKEVKIKKNLRLTNRSITPNRSKKEAIR